MSDIKLGQRLNLFSKQRVALQESYHGLLLVKNLHDFKEFIEVYVLDKIAYVEAALAGVGLFKHVA